MSRVIALNGDLAGGKTTVGKMLAAHFGVELVTMGVVQRQIAAERGITTLELNQLSESDPAIDRLIDGTVGELGESGRSLVMDSRLSWHFIPRAFKVHLIVDGVVAAERAINRQAGGTESYGTATEAIEKLAARRASERERFLTKYGVDLDRLKNYDAVVDTTSASPEEVVSAIIMCLDEDRADPKPYLLLDPKRLVPEETLLEIGGDEPTEVSRNVESVMADELVGVGRLGAMFFVLEGRESVIRAIQSGRSLIACHLVEELEEMKGRVNNNVTPTLAV